MAGSQDPRCQDSRCHQKGTPVGALSAALGPEGVVGVEVEEEGEQLFVLPAQERKNKEQRKKQALQ